MRLVLQHRQHRVRETVLGAELRNGLGLEVEPVVGAELRQLLRVELAGHQSRHLVEEVLEAARRDDLEDPARAVAGFQKVCHWLRGLNAKSPASA